jgi:parvulin-like peptidyl-prolyl isomerase
MKKLLLSLAIFIAPFVSHVAFGQVLATVGNAKITAEEFKHKLSVISKKVANPPTPEQFLEDLIRFEAALQEADRLKLQNDPIVKENFQQVLYNAIIERAIGKKVEEIKINEAELRSFYKSNPEFRVAHLFIEVKPGAKAEDKAAAQKRATEIFDEIKKSKRGFEEFVKLYSDDYSSKEIGGDMGFVSRVTLHPAMYNVAAKMSVGEVRGPIEAGFGYHIIKLLDKRAFDLADKRQIRAAIFEEKRAKLFNEYFEKLKKQYKIQVNKDALKSLKL